MGHPPLRARASRRRHAARVYAQGPAGKKGRALQWLIRIAPAGFAALFVVETAPGAERRVGLASVRAAVEGLGGSVHVRSELHKGTLFVLQVPVAAAAPKERDAREAA